jgi:hypothetical protein
MKNLPEKNKKLEKKIKAKYPSFISFAYVIGEHESLVSKVLNGWRTISEERQEIWAQALDCEAEEIFPSTCTNQEKGEKWHGRL